MDSFATTQPHRVHLAHLGWTPDTSTNAFPEASTALKVAAQIVQDGFATETEPLLCMHSLGPHARQGGGLRAPDLRRP